MAYTNQASLEGYLKRSLTSGELTLLNDVLLAAIKLFIDRVTGTTFEKEEGAEKYYDTVAVQGKAVNKIKELAIDPLLEVETVEIVDADDNVVETLDSDQYVLYPLNSTPKTSIRKRSGYWGNSPRRIKITGDFGSSEEVPADIQLAATMLIAIWFDNPEDLESESIEGYSRTFGNRAVSNKELMGILLNRTVVVV